MQDLFIGLSLVFLTNSTGGGPGQGKTDKGEDIGHVNAAVVTPAKDVTRKPPTIFSRFPPSLQAVFSVWSHGITAGLGPSRNHTGAGLAVTHG